MQPLRIFPLCAFKTSKHNALRLGSTMAGAVVVPRSNNESKVANARKFSGKTLTPLDINPKSQDPEGLLEFSVVYTDRTVNHMSKSFQATLKQLVALLCRAYNAEKAVLIPGSGSTAMEAVVRQFANEKDVLVIRNGYFSFRWSQIFDAGKIVSKQIVCRARPVEDCANPSYAPCPMEEVIKMIETERPAVVFAPHVETSAGMMLTDEYIRKVGAAAKSVGALFVLDCIASGCLWIDMSALDVDVLITAPQKGWSAPAGVGVVMLGARALEAMKGTTSSSFVLNLQTWTSIVDAYHGPPPGHAYHATYPTDVIRQFHEAATEVEKLGFETLRNLTIEQGQKSRAVIVDNGFKSLAAAPFQAPTVAVHYTSDPAVKSGACFAQHGMQIAAGVPLMCDDFTSGADFMTWRIGLFGLDKLCNVDRTVALLEDAVTKSAGRGNIDSM